MLFVSQSQNQADSPQALATVEADSSDRKQDGKQDTLVERESVSEKSGSGPDYHPSSSLLFQTCRDGL
jgi:hypothetical protein